MEGSLCMDTLRTCGSQEGLRGRAPLDELALCCVWVGGSNDK